MIRTAALYLLGVAGYLGLLTIVGYPFRELCAVLTWPDERLPAPVLGLPVTQLFAWYWLRFTPSGLETGLHILFSIAIVVCGALLVYRRKWNRPSTNLALPILCVLGAMAIAAMHFSPLFSHDSPTMFTAGNNDTVGYAIHVQHVLERGDEPGNVSGFDIGASALRQVFGAIASAAMLPAASGLPVWKLGGAFLLTTMFLCVYATAWWLRQLAPISALTASFVATLSAAGLLFVYVATQFYLAQLLTMAMLPVVAALFLRAADGGGLRRQIGVVVPLTLLAFALMATYGHMAFLAPPILAAAAVFAGSGRRKRCLRIAMTTTSAFLGAALLAPPIAAEAVRTLRYLAKVEAGWPLSGFLPVELLGFTRSLDPIPSLPRWAWSSAILLVFGAAVAVIWRKQPVLARFSTATVVCTLFSYVVVYLREGGPSYRQWKWITLFDQMIASLIVLVVAIAIVVALDKAHVDLPGIHFPPRQSRLRVGTVACWTALLAYGTALGLASRSQPGTGAHNWRPIHLLTNRHADVAEHPALRPLTEINIEALPFWDALWLAYFLRDKTIYLLEPNYYPISPVTADWTVERIESEVTSHIKRHGGFALNNTFRLLREDRDCAPSSDGVGLSSGLTVRLDPQPVVPGAITGRAQVTNIGTACWLASKTSRGGIKLTADLTDGSGAVVTPDRLRSDFIPEGVRPLRPGDSASVDFAIPASSPGRYVLKFRLLSEGVGRFGEEVAVPIEVR